MNGLVLGSLMSLAQARDLYLDCFDWGVHDPQTTDRVFTEVWSRGYGDAEPTVVQNLHQWPTTELPCAPTGSESRYFEVSGERFRLRINGSNAVWFDRLWVQDSGTTSASWGRDGGGGYCLSTRREVAFGDRQSGRCLPCLELRVGGNVAAPCGSRVRPGTYIALYQPDVRRAAAMNGEGLGVATAAVGDSATYTPGANPDAVWRVVDAGEGLVALYNEFRGRFLRLSPEGVVGSDGIVGSDNLPADWHWEVFEPIDLASGKVGLWSLAHGKFLRLTPGGAFDTSGENQPPRMPDSYGWERFQVLETTAPNRQTLRSVAADAQCLALPGVDNAGAGPVEVYSCRATPHRDSEWVVIPVDGTYSRIMNVTNRLCLGVAGVDAHGVGGAVEVYGCGPHGSDAHHDSHWELRSVAGAPSRRMLVNRVTSLCLGVTGTPADGSLAIMEACPSSQYDDTDRQWTLQAAR